MTAPNPAPENPLLAVVAGCVNRAGASFLETVSGEAPTVAPDGSSMTGSERVVGLISFSGDTPFVFLMGLPEKTAGPLVQKFTGFEFEFRGSDMGDVVGELVNVIAGDMVAQVERAGAKVAMGLPTVARGQDLDMVPSDRNPSSQTVFLTPQGPVWVKVAVARPPFSFAAKIMIGRPPARRSRRPNRRSAKARAATRTGFPTSEFLLHRARERQRFRRSPPPARDPAELAAAPPPP